MTEISLEFIGERLERIQAEQADMRAGIARVEASIASIKDDINVLTAIVLRLDGSTGREFRSLYEQIGRMTERIRKIEQTDG
jgi:hypothetical protein